MGAFSYHRHQTITDALNELFKRCLWYYTDSVDMTHDDMMQLFVKPEHRNVVREILEIADVSFNNGTATVFVPTEHGPQQLYLNMQACGDKTPFIMPRYALDGPLEDLPPEVVGKLSRFATLRQQLSVDFGHMMMLVNWLQEHCATPMQARFVCPSLVGLIAMSEDGRDMADQLRPFRMPTALPRLPRGLAPYAKEIDARIARAMLLPKLESASPGYAKEVVVMTQPLSSGPPPWNKSQSGIRL